MRDNNDFSHQAFGDRNNEGENIAWSMSSVGFDIVAGSVQAVENWYGEIADYNWDDPEYDGDQNGVIGHLTQVVWKLSTEYGTGAALSSDGTQLYVVGRYWEIGNWMGQLDSDNKLFILS